MAKISGGKTEFCTVIHCGSAAAVQKLINWLDYFNDRAGGDPDKNPDDDGLTIRPLDFPFNPRIDLTTGNVILFDLFGTDCLKIWNEEDLEIETLAHLLTGYIDTTPEAAAIQGLQYATFADGPLPDYFGGGVVVFRRGHPFEHATTFQAMMNRIDRMHGREPNSKGEAA